MARRAGLMGRIELSEWFNCKPGRKGVRAARRVLEFAEMGAEPPMETRLWMLLVLNGLPRPEVQITIRDKAAADVVSRPDSVLAQVRDMLVKR
jgi:hypothetical protein